MATVKLALYPKGMKKKMAATPPQQLNANDNIAIVVFDQNGAVISGIDPTTVLVTITPSDPGVAIASGSDALHETMTIATTVTTQFTLTADVTFLSGAVGPFEAVGTYLPPPIAQLPTSIGLVVTPS